MSSLRRIILCTITDIRHCLFDMLKILAMQECIVWAQILFLVIHVLVLSVSGFRFHYPDPSKFRLFSRLIVCYILPLGYWHKNPFALDFFPWLYPESTACAFGCLAPKAPLSEGEEKGCAVSLVSVSMCYGFPIYES